MKQLFIMIVGIGLAMLVSGCQPRVSTPSMETKDGQVVRAERIWRDREAEEWLRLAYAMQEVLVFRWENGVIDGWIESDQSDPPTRKAIHSSKNYEPHEQLSGTLTIRLQKQGDATGKESSAGRYTYSIEIATLARIKTTSSTGGYTLTTNNVDSIRLGESTVRITRSDSVHSMEIEESGPRVYQLTNDGATLRLRRRQPLKGGSADGDWLELKVVPPTERPKKPQSEVKERKSSEAEKRPGEEKQK